VMIILCCDSLTYIMLCLGLLLLRNNLLVHPVLIRMICIKAQREQCLGVDHRS
jgi:hypothetical protein